MKKDVAAKIFIVEDEPFFANLINYDLEANYYDGISVYFNGEDAIENLGLNPRVVILDNKLPGISGLEVLKKIKASAMDTQISAFKNGAHDFIIKNENAFEEVRGLLKKIFTDPVESSSELKVKNFPGRD